MSGWDNIREEIKVSGSTHDIIRRKYLKELHEITERNIIVYYSGWLQKPELIKYGTIDDNDKIGLMATIYKLDRSKGLDLILHTPGGGTAATESFVDYLRQIFGSNMRAIVPQLAMSGGTMIACACKSIVMGKQSSLGPIDPQLKGLAAHGVVEEFKTAYEEIKKDANKIPIWQPIIAKYDPTLIGECQKAISWSEEMVKNWLLSGMLNGVHDADLKADKIIYELGHTTTKSHDRHLSASKCKEIGLTIEMMEDNQPLQDAILKVHHTTMLTFNETRAMKIIENHEGKAYVQQIQVSLVPK